MMKKTGLAHSAWYVGSKMAWKGNYSVKKGRTVAQRLEGRLENVLEGQVIC